MGRNSNAKWVKRAENCQLTVPDTKGFFKHLKKNPVMEEIVGRKQQVSPLKVLAAIRKAAEV